MKNDIGTRMKDNYENRSKTSLLRRTPVILRLDGCHFHTFTKGFKKPFDKILMETMAETTKRLCANIQGCVFGYAQSDEITLVLCDYQTLNTEAWFDYEVQKLCSVAASMCSRFFNEIFITNVNERIEKMKKEKDDSVSDQYLVYKKKFFCADFDCRAFNIPVAEVANCIIWRQKDAEKNSVQALAQSMYHQYEINGLSTCKLKEKMLFAKGTDWNTLANAKKYGVACVKNEDDKWEIDNEMPVVTSNREYVEKHIVFPE